MNRVFVVGTGICKSTTEHASRPEFRRATRNMILAQVSLDEALQPLQPWLAENTESVGFVLGTSHGELDVTMNFLETLANTGIARPILFQNSLHNSTSGFLAMNQKLTGPMLTVSHMFYSGEDALATALLLIRQKQCHFCCVTGVETQVLKVMPDGEKPNFTGVQWDEGAATVVLCDEYGLKSAGLHSIAELLEVRIDREPRSAANPSRFYESDAVELWVRAIRSTPTSESPLRLRKPDGTGSEIEWRR